MLHFSVNGSMPFHVILRLSNELESRRLRRYTFIAISKSVIAEISIRERFVNHYIQRSACSGTGVTSLPLSNADLTFLITSSSIAVSVSTLQVPIWGSNITCGLLSRPGWISGSFSNTSRPHDKTWPLSSALTSASSSSPVLAYSSYVSYKCSRNVTDGVYM